MTTLHAELAHIIKEGTPDVNNRLVEEFVDHVGVMFPTSTSCSSLLGGTAGLLAKAPLGVHRRVAPSASPVTAGDSPGTR